MGDGQQPDADLDSMDEPQRGLSPAAHREVIRKLEGLTDAQADHVAMRLAEQGPLAGALGTPGRGRVPQTREEVEALVIAMFDQHALDAPEPGRETLDLALLEEAVADALCDS